jgi:hypothetical protein
MFMNNTLNKADGSNLIAPYNTITMLPRLQEIFSLHGKKKTQGSSPKEPCAIYGRGEGGLLKIKLIHLDQL